jgi:hypothetical protein
MRKHPVARTAALLGMLMLGALGWSAAAGASSA